MDTWFLPVGIDNALYVLQNNMPLSSRNGFDAALAGIDHLPDPLFVAREQGKDAERSGRGTDWLGYLDGLDYWFVLTLLVDSEIGVLPHVKSPEDRQSIQRVQAMCLRWLDGQVPSEEEWDAAGETDQGTEEVQMLVFHAALTAKQFSSGLDFFLIELAKYYQGKPLPAWATRRIGPPESVFTALKKWPLRLLTDRIVAKSDGGNQKYYLAAVNWLLRLLQLRWPTGEGDAKTLFNSALHGDATALSKHVKMLKDEGVELEAIEQISSTMRKLAAARTPV